VCKRAGLAGLGPRLKSDGGIGPGFYGEISRRVGSRKSAALSGKKMDGVHLTLGKGLDLPKEKNSVTIKGSSLNNRREK